MAASQGMTLMEEMVNAGATTVAELLKSTGMDKDVDSGEIQGFKLRTEI